MRPAPSQRELPRRLWLGLLLVALTAASAGCGGSGGASDTSDPDTTPETPASTQWPPFSPTSSWNARVPAGATYTPLAWPEANGANYWVNWESYSPAVHVGNPSDPLVRVSFGDSWGWPAQTVEAHLPASVTGAAGTDGEIVFISGTTAHNCWQFVRTSTITATCQAYARDDIVTGRGWGRLSPFRGAGITAAGSNLLAGLLVQAETGAGEIAHALQIAIDLTLQGPEPTGEAIRSDGWASGSAITRQGERLAIPPNTPMPEGLSTLGQKVFRALRDYGAFNIDSGDGATGLRAQANAYDPATIDALREDVNRLIPLLHRVD
jgi:hypothetical protein